MRALQPIVTPAWAVSVFMTVGVLFVPLGTWLKLQQAKVVEIVQQYDGEGGVGECAISAEDEGKQVRVYQCVWDQLILSSCPLFPMVNAWVCEIRRCSDSGLPVLGASCAHAVLGLRSVSDTDRNCPGKPSSIAKLSAYRTFQHFRVSSVYRVRITGRTFLPRAQCQMHFSVEEDMDGPVYVYYELQKFYQNHRNYVKSRSYDQLEGGVGSWIAMCSSVRAPRSWEQTARKIS